MENEVAKPVADTRFFALKQVGKWIEDHSTYFEGCYDTEFGYPIPMLSVDDRAKLVLALRNGVMPIE